MNKNTKIFLIIFLILVIIAVIVFLFNQGGNTNNNSDYNDSKTSYENSANTETGSNNDINNATSNNENIKKDESVNNDSNTKTEIEVPVPAEKKDTNVPHEEELSAFSTHIYDTNSARQNNVELTVSAINGVTVANGETFSFCETVGPATTEKGYQKADIFDANGNKKKGLGGGNCQVSTTLYNAILPIENINITERHAHSNYVPYIEKGKDAATAYGSYDLKFVNQCGSTIKINASTDGATVDVQILKVG